MCFFTFVSLFECMCACAHTPPHACGHQKKMESVLSSSGHVGSRDQINDFWLGHLTSSKVLRGFVCLFFKKNKF